ncbi:SulP family inorganic anion transporter [Alkalicoccus chagannorensis]|uniref:SulP family inorganic anion transporter n=1 Tax=Alkalicoccus chagannorensis TaxID=427072 RepID=UPI0003F8C002|nr:sulfate permease [Alkalicoccus chagannorensis]
MQVADWLTRSPKEYWKGDVSAGILVAVMLVPQGMAYAMLAGMPPVTGLYAAVIPMLIYAMFGSSRQLAVGPVAVVSLLVYTGVSPLAEPGSPEFISLALLLMLMSGGIQLIFGLLKLGFIVKFFSHAVISGFISAAALIIAFSQLEHALGISLQADSIPMMLAELPSHTGNVHLITLMISAGAVFVLLYGKKWMKSVPPAIVVVAASILLTSLLSLQQQGVHIVGEVPGGLPPLTLPAVDFQAVQLLLPAALTISLIGFIESYAMAKVMAEKDGIQISADRELRSLGLANAGGSFFGGFPVTGGFSRSAVNYDAGATSQFSSVIAALLLLLTLLFFTDLFYFLPQAVLAAVIIAAVIKLVNVKEGVHYFRVNRTDGAVWLVTFAATIILGVETGILTGILFSLAALIWQSAYPHMAELGYVKEKDVLRNVKRYPDAVTTEKNIILRIDAPFYFANAAFVTERLENVIREREKTERIILDCSGVNMMDAVAAEEAFKWKAMADRAGKELLFAELRGPVRDTLQRAGWPEEDLYLTLKEVEAYTLTDAPSIR